MSLEKKKKRLEQIAMEIEEKQAQFDKLIEEGMKILEISEREYQNTIENAEIKLTKSRKQIILEAGHYLENNLEIVPNNSKNEICKMLKERFKGIINPTNIWFHCPEEWKSAIKVELGRRGGIASQISSKISSNNAKPLTEYEEKYVAIHEEKIHRNEHIEALINDFLGLTPAQQSEISGAAPKGTDRIKLLIEHGYPNMLRIAKGLNDADIPALLGAIRNLRAILSKMGDVVLAEYEQRKKKQGMTGQ
jgi:hypothetical protein